MTLSTTQILRRIAVLATVLATTVTLTLALTADLVALAELTSALLLLVFIAINGALIVLKRRALAPVGVFNCPALVPWFGVVGSAAAFIWTVA